MPAYMTPIKTTCDKEHCSSRAVEEVFNGFNASLGRFCRKHAKDLVGKLNTPR